MGGRKSGEEQETRREERPQHALRSLCAMNRLRSDVVRPSDRGGSWWWLSLGSCGIRAMAAAGLCARRSESQHVTAVVAGDRSGVCRTGSAMCSRTIFRDRVRRGG